MLNDQHGKEPLLIGSLVIGPAPSVDPGAAEQDVQHWSLEEAAEAAEEHGGPQSDAGPAAGVLRPGETAAPPQ